MSILEQHNLFYKSFGAESFTFKKELTRLVNKYSLDTQCDTADYILADYLERCLDNFKISFEFRRLTQHKLYESDETHILAHQEWILEDGKWVGKGWWCLDNPMKFPVKDESWALEEVKEFDINRNPTVAIFKRIK